MEPERPQEPLNDEQIWGDPPDVDDDYIMENILNDDMGDYCPECGRPYYLCICERFIDEADAI